MYVLTTIMALLLSSILVTINADDRMARQTSSCLSQTLMNVNDTGAITFHDEDFDICVQNSPSTVAAVCFKTTTAKDNTTVTFVRVRAELLTVVSNVIEENMLSNADKLCGTDTLTIEIRSGILPVDRTTQEDCQQSIHEAVILNQLSAFDNNLDLASFFFNILDDYSYYVEFTYEFLNNSYERRLLTDECKICDGRIISASEYQRHSQNGRRPFISIGTFHSDVNVNLENGSVLLCDEGHEPGERPLFSSVPGGLELAQALTVLSLIGLLLTFITYLYFRKLRNVPGKIIMNLLVALFVALSSICLGPSLLFPDSVCLASAIVFHYFWLAAFFWMNILSIDTTYILSCKPFMSMDASSGRYRLCTYYAYGWGAPGMFVLVCIALHYCKCTSFGFEYGYDDGICWTNDGTSGLYFFVVPSGILLVTNVIMLCITIVTIWRTSRRTQKTGKNAEKFAASRREFLVFLKLFTLMGLPWLLGNITAFYFTHFLEYIYIILNSLQGVLIFIALVVTGRGGHYWKERWMTRGQTSMPRGGNGGTSGRTTGPTGTGSTDSGTPMTIRRNEGVEMKDSNAEPGNRISSENSVQ